MNEGLIDTIARLCELLDRETAGLRQGNSGVVADARQRKAQAFMELSRALSGLPEREAKDARLRASLRDLHAKLADNARVLKIHLDALGEITAMLAAAIRDSDWDGTYSAPDFGKSAW